MGQQISVEAALDAFRTEFGKVVDENVLLKAHISELEKELARLQASAQGPASGDPDAATAVPHTADERP